MPLIIFQNLLGLVFQVFSLTRRVVLGSAFVEPGQFYRRLSPSWSSNLLQPVGVPNLIQLTLMETSVADAYSLVGSG